MTELPKRDWSAATPVPPSDAKIRAIRTAARLVPVGVRKALLQRRRERARAERRRLEAQGDFSRSRPALYGIDRVLEEHLDTTRPGFFVEAGAYDGFEQSNTYLLERRFGWRGVMVEPVPELHRHAVAERPATTVVNCALKAADDPRDTLTMTYGALMSTVAGAQGGDERSWVRPAFALGLEKPYEITVPARTLSDVLDEAGAPADFELLSLDVEGFEEQVLRGLDLDRHRPALMVVEMHEIEAGRAAIEPILGDRYDPIEQLSPLDVLYRRTRS